MILTSEPPGQNATYDRHAYDMCLYEKLHIAQVYDNDVTRIGAGRMRRVWASDTECACDKSWHRHVRGPPHILYNEHLHMRASLMRDHYNTNT